VSLDWLREYPSLPVRFADGSDTIPKQQAVTGLALLAGNQAQY
jgi:hypothetical protein